VHEAAAAAVVLCEGEVLALAGTNAGERVAPLFEVGVAGVGSAVDDVNGGGCGVTRDASSRACGGR
jgi:hypothetical protein